MKSCANALSGGRLRRLWLLAMLLACCAALPLRAADAARFDGDWDVTLSCPKSPDGAMAFSFEFAAQVKGGVLHGERGTAGAPGWLSLDGPIGEDGSAALVAEGITNYSQYALHHVRPGTAYKHAVSAQFSGSHGTGSWTAIRTCNFTFERSGGKR